MRYFMEFSDRRSPVAEEDRRVSGIGQRGGGWTRVGIDT